MQEFRDRVAVVTGAASGIGFAMAERFAAEGMKVVMADIETEALAIAAAGLEKKGAVILASRTDVSKAEEIEKLAQKTFDAFGGVHVLCNNAGVEVIGLTWEHTLADWEWVLGVNLWGVIHGVRSFLPRMLEMDEEAHIVNTASMAGLTTAPFMSVYDVSKHGVVALSESLYKELAATGAKVGVSVLCPGLINTNIIQSKRNRPAALDDEGRFGEASKAFRAGLATGLETGWPPSQVADEVFAAIQAKRFYVVASQPELKDSIRLRAEDLIEERNPTIRDILAEADQSDQVAPPGDDASAVLE
ncbi:MAG: SDR family NAD(P)-dependent oxidoreductase [Tepidiformaceae bacterium]